MSYYNTNLASEFYVLSILHRLGADANLTLGNKKSVDIAVVKDAGNSVTVDVKGLAGKTSWPVDNVKEAIRNHYLVFVSYLGKISEPEVLPEVYVIPSGQVAKFTYHSPNGKRKVVPLGTLRKDAKKYKDAWHFIT
mgnify:CR=1 FL=1